MIDQPRNHALPEPSDQTASGTLAPRLCRGEILDMVHKADHSIAVAAFRKP